MFSNKGDKELISDNCPFLLLTQTLLCVPPSHTGFLLYQHHPSHQVGTAWVLIGICPKAWARSGLQCFFTMFVPVPLELLNVPPGGLAWKWGLCWGHNLRWKAKELENWAFTLSYKHFLSALCNKLPKWKFPTSTGDITECHFAQRPDLCTPLPSACSSTDLIIMQSFVSNWNP